MGKGRKTGVNHAHMSNREMCPMGPGGPCSKAEGAQGARESTRQRFFEAGGKNGD